MTRLTIYTFLAVLAALSLLAVDGPVPVALLSGVATGLAVPAVDAAVANGRYLRLLWPSIRYFRKEVRISISYLYRIEDRGRYLLIKGQRLENQYQPVGGVYKFNPSARGRLQNWGVLTDDLIPIDKVSQDDLRIRTMGRNLIPLVRWFAGGTSRESGPWREFYEELVKTEILPAENFPHVAADYVRRHFTRIRYSSFSQCPELLIADIYELVPTDSQRADLQLLTAESSASPQYIWADAALIKRRGTIPGRAHETKIAVTAEWTLS